MQDYYERQRRELEQLQQQQVAVAAAAAAKVEKERQEKEKTAAAAANKKKDELPQPPMVQRTMNASSEVKQRLQEFLAKKQAREQAAAAAAAVAAAAAAAAGSGPVPSPQTGAPGNRIPWHLTLGKYDHDFPLRKTGMSHLQTVIIN